LLCCSAGARVFGGLFALYGFVGDFEFVFVEFSLGFVIDELSSV